jgi:hypothetical protein
MLEHNTKFPKKLTEEGTNPTQLDLFNRRDGHVKPLLLLNEDWLLEQPLVDERVVEIWREKFVLVQLKL